LGRYTKKKIFLDLGKKMMICWLRNLFIKPNDKSLGSIESAEPNDKSLGSIESAEPNDSSIESADFPCDSPKRKRISMYPIDCSCCDPPKNIKDRFAMRNHMRNHKVKIEVAAEATGQDYVNFTGDNQNFWDIFRELYAKNGYVYIRNCLDAPTCTQLETLCAYEQYIAKTDGSAKKIMGGVTMVPIVDTRFESTRNALENAREFFAKVVNQLGDELIINPEVVLMQSEANNTEHQLPHVDSVTAAPRCLIFLR